MKLKLSAPAIVTYENTDEEVVDMRTLIALTHTVYAESLAEHLQPFTPTNAGLSGGYLRFELDANGIRVVTEYETTRTLADNELSALVDYTLTQWIEGIGNNFAQDYARKTGIAVAFYANEDMVKVEHLQETSFA